MGRVPRLSIVAALVTVSAISVRNRPSQDFIPLMKPFIT